MKFLALIPARYGSSRFEGKPLADILGKPMIQRVYERASEVFSDCYVATDHELIYDRVIDFGGKAVMTSINHKSGTDRCYEAMQKIGNNFDVVINIQGDEPFIAQSQLIQIKNLFEDIRTQIGTLVKPFTANEIITNSNSPKVVMDIEGFALYFSRSVIPYIRGEEMSKWQENHTYYKHIGLYGYRSNVLKQIASMPQSKLEVAEALEQLRWLENGLKIKTDITLEPSYAIDTIEDLTNVVKYFSKKE